MSQIVMPQLPFTKMHGIGNDYVYVNGFDETIEDPPAFARAISNRHFGIGSDGLILVLPPEPGVEADVRMRMFNADGSESEMCGNGVRCVCKFAHDRGLATANPMRIQTGAGVLALAYECGSDGTVEQVTVDMGRPVLDPARVPVKRASPGNEPIIDAPISELVNLSLRPECVDARPLEAGMTCVSMGNPHVIIYHEDVAAVPLESIGPFLEEQPIFPNRINVHYVQVHSGAEVTMRTWERGSGITLACGTGAAAVCVAGVLTGRGEREILAHLPGGDLRLRWDEATDHVFMIGPATEVFTGVWPESGVGGVR